MLQSFNKISIRNKLRLLVIISFVPLLAIFQWYILPAVREQWYENKYSATKNTVDGVFNTLQYYKGLADAGLLSEDDAKKTAAAVIASQRYEGDNYFWINNTEHILIAHPLRPKNVGKDMSSFEDAVGKKIYQEFVKVSVEKGEGFVQYLQKSPMLRLPYPKLHTSDFINPGAGLLAAASIWMELKQA